MEVGEKIEKLIDEALERRKFLTLYFCAEERLDSPLERLLYAAFQACEIDCPHNIKLKLQSFSSGMPFEIVAEWRHGLFERHVVSIFPQIQIGSYRVDFLAVGSAKDGSNNELNRFYLAVECDGHEFHERTKEQAAHDKARDRYLLHHQVPAMRFAGSEIWANPMACVGQILDYFQTHIGPQIPKRDKGTPGGEDAA